jgi:uncharacterized hydrophobic protein (TIGR00271 family)
MTNSIASMFKARSDIQTEIEAGRRFDALYFSLLIFGCLIALLGLLLNSPAVIIGAMLISPLMGPILACGLAFSTADLPLLKKAGRNVLMSVAETIAIAALGTILSPIRDLTPEIIARTNPNLMDLFIALFSGIAGTLALTARRPNLTIVPGVAIATAVMPPLATTGYAISTAQWDLARGAFMLFATNFMAIAISAGAVFLLIGFRPGRGSHPGFARWRVPVAVVITCVLSVPLMRTLLTAAEQTRITREAKSTIERLVDGNSKRRVDDITVRVASDRVRISASVQTPTYIDHSEISAWEERVKEVVGRNVEMHVTQLQLAEHRPEPTRSNDYVAAGVVRPAAAKQERTASETGEELEQNVTRAAVPLVRAAGLKDASVESVTYGAGTLQIGISGSDPTGMNASSAAVAARAISDQLRVTVQLQINAVAEHAVGAVTFSKNDTISRRGRSQLLKAWKALGDVPDAISCAASPKRQSDVLDERCAAIAKLLGTKSQHTRSFAEQAAPTGTDVPHDTIEVYPIRVITGRAESDQKPDRDET